MPTVTNFFRLTAAAAAIAFLSACILPLYGQPLRKMLYVAEPGIRNYLEYGGHGILVYDIDNDFALVKRIATGSFDSSGHPSNVKGVCVSLATQCIYISTIKSLQCVSLQSEKIVWERTYGRGCDRMAISSDGLTIFQPSFENDRWYVIDARTGKVKQEIVLSSKAHNTVAGLTGHAVYMEGLASPLLTVVNASNPAARKSIGPFSDMIRPFTINGKQNRVFVNVNNLLGFEVGDLLSGKMLYRVEVEGYRQGMIKRHGCPSHGIGLTPDEKELWVADGANQALHVFDATQMPPVQQSTIILRDQPGWITFSLDGKYAFPSTGEIIDIATKKIIKSLADEKGGVVQSEKMIEIHFKNGKAVAKGDQFGLGRVLK